MISCTSSATRKQQSIACSAFSSTINESIASNNSDLLVANCTSPLSVVIAPSASAFATFWNISLMFINCSNITVVSVTGGALENVTLTFASCIFSGSVMILAPKTSSTSIVFDNVAMNVVVGQAINPSCLVFSANSTHSALGISASRVTATYTGYAASWVRFDNLTADGLSLYMADSTFSGYGGVNVSWNWVNVIRFSGGTHRQLSILGEQLVVDITSVTPFSLVSEHVTAAFILTDFSIVEATAESSLVWVGASIILRNINAALSGLTSALLGGRTLQLFPMLVYNTTVYLRNVSCSSQSLRRAMIVGTSRADASNLQPVGKQLSYIVAVDNSVFSARSAKVAVLGSVFHGKVSFTMQNCTLTFLATNGCSGLVVQIYSMFDVTLPQIIVKISNVTVDSSCTGTLVTIGTNPRSSSPTPFAVTAVDIAVQGSNISFTLGMELVFAGLLEVSSWVVAVNDCVLYSGFMFMAVIFGGPNISNFAIVSTRTTYTVQNCAGFLMGQTPLMPIQLFVSDLDHIIVVFVESSFTTTFDASRLPVYTPATLATADVPSLLTYYLARFFALIPVDCRSQYIELRRSYLEATSTGVSSYFTVGSRQEAATLVVADSVVKYIATVPELLFCAEGTLIFISNAAAMKLLVNVTVTRSAITIISSYTVGIAALGQATSLSQFSITFTDSTIFLQSSGRCSLSLLPARPGIFISAGSTFGPTSLRLKNGVVSMINTSLTLSCLGQRVALVSDVVPAPTAFTNCTFFFSQMTLSSTIATVPATLVLLEVVHSLMSTCTVSIVDCTTVLFQELVGCRSGAVVAQSQIAMISMTSAELDQQMGLPLVNFASGSTVSVLRTLALAASLDHRCSPAAHPPW